MANNAREFPHYFRQCPYDEIDYYRIAELFGIENPAIAHAFKKLLAAGKRGAKDTNNDVAEVIKTLQRWQEMRKEDAALSYDGQITMDDLKADNAALRNVISNAGLALVRPDDNTLRNYVDAIGNRVSLTDAEIMMDGLSCSTEMAPNYGRYKPLPDSDARNEEAHEEKVNPFDEEGD